MLKVVGTAVVASVFFASSAFAEVCTTDAEQQAGKVVGQLVKEKVSAVAPVEGKQMINLSDCEQRGGTIRVEFRYNYMSGGAYYWYEGKAELKPSGESSLSPSKLSDNLKAANAAKNGALLASS